MIKKLALLGATIAGLVMIPASTFAAPAQTNVSGVVKNGSSVVSDAKVIVICNNVAKSDKTDSTGTYLVHFTATQCPVGSQVSATAKKGHKGGIKYGTVNGVTNKLNIAIVNVDIPEYGLITGLAALTAAGAGFYLIRRKQIGQN